MGTAVGIYLGKLAVELLLLADALYLLVESVQSDVACDDECHSSSYRHKTYRCSQGYFNTHC